VIFVLYKGQVEQSGAPLDIFDKPATRFVAAFLGSPAMNFVDGVLENKGGKWSFRSRGGLVTAVDEGAFPEVAAGREVTLGVRPHEVTLAGEGEATGSLVVSIVEALGAETYAHGDLSGTFVARLEAGARVKKGETLPMTFRSIHLFDKSTGQSLRAT